MAETYKTGLYIENNKVDVENVDLFLFKYSNIDVTDPQAILNTYSKTVSLAGTSTNNKIFNNLWKLDTTLHTSTVLFDPMIRNSFEIYDNGNLLEAGYVQLNTIKYVKNDPVYEITLFGMLGDFFYKLMYKDETQETEMTLADLTYDYKRLAPNTILGEATREGAEYVPTQDINDYIVDADDSRANVTLLTWDKNYIWNSWLCSFTDKYKSTDYDIWEQFITAIPVYNGYHDDFDNDHVLINRELNGATIYPPEYNSILPYYFTKDNTPYRLNRGYARLETQRDMDEWEIRDLRSTFQRPGIRFGMLMQKISEYSEQQGYNIQWDKDIDITNTKPQDFSELNDYFWRTYILLDTIEFSEEKQDETLTEDIQGEWDSIDDNLPVEYIINPATHTDTFDLRGYTAPSIEINLTDEYRPYSFDTPPVNTPAIQRVNAGYNASTTVAHGREDRNNIFGAFIYVIEVEQNSVVLPEYTKVLYVSVDNFGRSEPIVDITTLNNVLLQTAQNDYGTTNYELINTTTINAMRPAEDYHFMIYDEPIKTYINNLPTEDNVKIRITKDYINLVTDRVGRTIGRAYWRPPNNVHPLYTQGTKWIICDADDDGTLKSWRYNYEDCLSNNFAADFKNRYYITASLFSGANTSMKNKNVTKNDLLANTSSPFKYLVDWCKLFNMRFRTDILTRTIHIEQPKNYYIDDIIDISSKIDYGKDFIIDPVYVENNIYKFTLEKEDNESYAKYIYNKAFNTDYSTMNVFTKYSFNNEPLDIFEDNVYNVNIDYMMSSPYLNTGLARGGVQYPPMTLMPKYEYFLWKTNSPEQENDSITLYGLQSFNALPSKEDAFTKQCLFDKEYKPISSNYSLVLFDGIYVIPENTNPDAYYFPYMLTDDIGLMDDLNDGNSCFLTSFYDDTTAPYSTDDYWVLRKNVGIFNKNNQTGDIGLWTFFLPIVHSSARTTLSQNFTKSYYFKTPNTNDSNAFFGNTIWEANSSMYNKWWMKYEQDVLDRDAKTVECYVFLDEQPAQALRKFYYFQNTLWSLIEINDYNFKNKDNDPVKCKFIKVEDKNNYIPVIYEPQPEPGPEPPGPVTDEDLYQCQWIIGQWGGDPFTEQDLEDALDMYYADWRIYTPNVDLFDEMVANIAEGYITGVHTVEKSMFNALLTIGVDFDVYGYYTIETEGEVIVIPHE